MITLIGCTSVVGTLFLLGFLGLLLRNCTILTSQCTDADPLALPNITAREVYAILVRNTGHKHQCVKKYSTIGVEWHAVWKNLDQLRHDRAALDTSWLISLGVLPKVDQLLQFGMSVSPWCHCGRRESIEHLSVECSFVS